MRYRSTRVADPAHLRPSLARAASVWVMGHLASNAVANMAVEFPKERRNVSEAPFPAAMFPGSRFFLSEYFSRWNESEIPDICRAFVHFVSSTGGWP
jgi:hypothetical protein